MLSAAFVDLLGYWLHRLSHKKWSPLYKPHMTHHVINYPPQSVMSKTYRSSRIDSLAIWFLPFGIVYIIAVVLLKAPHPHMIIAGGATVALLSSIIHDATHVERSFVWQHKFFKNCAIRHHAHHFKMRRNYGILTGLWDQIFQTRRR